MTLQLNQITGIYLVHTKSLVHPPPNASLPPVSLWMGRMPNMAGLIQAMGHGISGPRVPKYIRGLVMG